MYTRAYPFCKNMREQKHIEYVTMATCGEAEWEWGIEIKWKNILNKRGVVLWPVMIMCHELRKSLTQSFASGVQKKENTYYTNGNCQKDNCYSLTPNSSSLSLNSSLRNFPSSDPHSSTIAILLLEKLIWITLSCCFFVSHYLIHPITIFY